MNPSVSKVIPGQATIANANVRVPLLSSPQGCLMLVITAIDSNKGSLYIGGSRVTTGNGIQLTPTNSLTINIKDISSIYIVGANVGDGVSFAYYI